MSEFGSCRKCGAMINHFAECPNCDPQRKSLITEIPALGAQQAQARTYATAAVEADRKARAQPAVPKGWKLVPIEPTREMVNWACQDIKCFGENRWTCRDAYNALLAAAPTPPKEGGA